MTTHYRFTTTPLESGGVGIWLDTYVVAKETPKGYWLVPAYEIEWPSTSQNRRWVAKTGGKLAQTSVQEAWAAYQVRLRYRVMFLERDLRLARGAQKLASSAMAPPLPLDPHGTILESDDL